MKKIIYILLLFIPLFFLDCFAQKSNLVTYNIKPNINIQTSTNCLYTGANANFTANVTPANIHGVVNWDFGDGTTATSLPNTSILHTFNNNLNQGYYCVKATFISCCDTIYDTKNIFINKDSCYCLNNYDIPDGYTITTGNTEIWNTNKTVEGDVFIEQGAALFIQGTNTIIDFGPKGRIVVKENGNLEITDATLKGLECNNNKTMWQGIEIWAPNNNPNNNIAIKGSTIKDAHIAILVGKRNYNYCSNLTSLYIPQSNNVKIDVLNNKFINNGVGIKFTNPNTTYSNDTNNIVSNIFSSNTLNDNGYLITQPNHYPNARNPWVSGANNYQRALYGIYINNRCNFDILYNNSFANIDTCIKAIDSKLLIKGLDYPNYTIMQNFDYGIYAINTNSNIINNYEICNYEFLKDQTGNYNIPKNAIYIEAGNYDLIHDNKIGSDQATYTYPQITCGINLINTQNYKIYENKFYKCINGLQAYNNKYGFIGANYIQWNGNMFYENKIGILTKADNLHLQLKCNQHFPNSSGNNYTANWANYNVMVHNGLYQSIVIAKLANQGVPQNICSGSFVNRCPAGNRFQTWQHKEIKSNIASHYTYWKHNNSNSLSLELTPVPDNNITLNTDNYSIWQGQSESCKKYLPIIGPPGGGTVITLPPLNFNKEPYSKIDSIEQLKQQAINQKQNILNNIDNGQTQYLLNAINSNMPPFILLSILINNSPLSDTVLISFITSKQNFNPLAFTLVMMHNVPVSNKVYKYYIKRYAKLPGILKRYLHIVQQNPYIITPAYIDNNIQSYETLKSNVTNSIVSLLIDTNNNRINDAISVLEHDGSLNSKKTLVGTYTKIGNYSSANNILSQIPDDTGENKDFKELYTIIINLYEQGKTLYELDSISLVSIKELANKCPVNRSVSNAKAILDLLYNYKVAPCTEDIIPENRNFLQEYNGNQELEEQYFYNIDSDNALLGNNYPDPFNEYTILPYTLPEGLTGNIKIYDTNGKLIKVYKAETGENTIRIDTQKWSKGMYIIKLEINGFVFGKEKIIKK